MTLRAIIVVLVLMAAISEPASAETEPNVSAAPLTPKVRISALKLRTPAVTVPDRTREAKSFDIQTFVFTDCPINPEIGTYGCRVYPDDDDEPEVTDGDVLRAVREIGLPRLSVSIQPGERTLVNAATIFSTTPEAFDHSVTLLGFDVDVVATPTSYTWHHGDGTSRRTNGPGRAYPAFDITHKYREVADVAPRVDVTYRIRYRVDGGDWATIDQRVTAAGPPENLAVREAVPVLTKP